MENFKIRRVEKQNINNNNMIIIKKGWEERYLKPSTMSYLEENIHNVHTYSILYLHVNLSQTTKTNKNVS